MIQNNILVNNNNSNNSLRFFTSLCETNSILQPSWGTGPATFSRASAQYITDFEGVVRKVESGCVAVEGSRVVTNLLTYSEDLSNAAWVKYYTCTVTGTNTVNFPAELDQIQQGITISIQPGSVVLYSVTASGSGTIKMELNRVGAEAGDSATKTITLSETPTTYTIRKVYTVAHAGLVARVVRSAGLTSTTMTIHNVQLENITAKTYQNPTDYVSTTSTPVTKCFSNKVINLLDKTVIIGDSFTYAGVYPTALSDASHIYTITNKGVSGNKLSDMLARFSTDVVGLSPNNVIIQGGVNDAYALRTLASMQSDVEDMVALSTAANIAPILTTIPPSKGNVAYTTAIQTLVDQYNYWIEDYATTNDYQLIDLNIVLADTDGMTLKAEYDSGDFLHPNTAGYTALGEYIASFYSTSTASLPQSYPERTNDTAYALGAKIQVNGWWYYCTTAGTSAGSTPTFPQGKAGSQTVTDGTAVWTIGGRLLLGYVSEPASTNKVTAYGIIPADTLGSELSSGSLTIGQKYQITARTDADFTADGAADNVVGTQFVATAATVTLDAGDKVKRVQWGVGEKSFHNGSAFVQNITGLALSGDTAAVLSIVTDQTEIEKAGLAGINPTFKVYKLDNSAGSIQATVQFSGTVGNTNPHSTLCVIRKTGTAKVATSLSDGNGDKAVTTTSYSVSTYFGAVPNATGRVLQVYALAGGVGYILLPQLEELPYATGIMPTAGATATRAETSLSYPTAGNLRGNDVTVGVEAYFVGLNSTSNSIFHTRSATNNYLSLYTNTTSINFNKRITTSYLASTSAPATINAQYKVLGKVSKMSGVSIFSNGAKGSTTNSNTVDAPLGNAFYLGQDGNSALDFQPMSGYLRNLKIWFKPLSDDRCKQLTL